MDTIRKALALLTPREKRRGMLLLAIATLMALLEVVGVASVMPFLAVMADPRRIEASRLLTRLYDGLGFTSTEQFLLFLGAASFTLLVIAAVVRSFGQYALVRFAQMRRHSISERLLETYLRQPYEFFLNRHSGDLTKGILSEVDQVVSNVYQPAIFMAAQVITLAAITLLLIVIDPWVALSAGVLMAGAYSLTYWLIRGTVHRIGNTQVESNRQRFEAASEALGGIKDIKFLGREHAYLERFRRPSFEMARGIAANTTLSLVPRYAIEAIAFGGILLLSLVLLNRSGGHSDSALGEVLPLLGLYALAGYRMLPAAQAIYQSMTLMRFGAAAVDNLYADLAQREHLDGLTTGTPARLALHKQVELQGVCYAYPGVSEGGLRDINLSIPIGTTIGVVGSTGAGKTTLVDVILGLLPPQSGKILVDDLEVTAENRRGWMANIGYVPQHIFLSDSTVAQNIALGLPDEAIDRTRVQDCARLARISDFVENELSDGYDTKIGERGVRLSGGQRQRIGIARALYHDPELIVFDEATSALDNLTEQEVMRAVNTLSGSKTIIMVAHRLSTVKICDQIAVLDRGKIAGLGTYADLSRSNSAFKQIASGLTAQTDAD